MFLLFDEVVSPHNSSGSGRLEIDGGDTARHVTLRVLGVVGVSHRNGTGSGEADAVAVGVVGVGVIKSDRIVRLED